MPTPAAAAAVFAAAADISSFQRCYFIDTDFITPLIAAISR
jgi:hypothetical protein